MVMITEKVRFGILGVDLRSASVWCYMTVDVSELKGDLKIDILSYSAMR